MPPKITRRYLRDNPNQIFVFGDNTVRKGRGGAAILRDEPNAYGFITKKYPNNRDESFYRPDEYQLVFNSELNKLINAIEYNSNCEFLITQLGGGLANKYGIWEAVIKPGIEVLRTYKNVQFLWEE